MPEMMCSTCASSRSGRARRRFWRARRLMPRRGPIVRASAPAMTEAHATGNSLKPAKSSQAPPPSAASRSRLTSGRRLATGCPMGEKPVEQRFDLARAVPGDGDGHRRDPVPKLLGNPDPIFLGGKDLGSEALGLCEDRRKHRRAVGLMVRKGVACQDRGAEPLKRVEEFAGPANPREGHDPGALESRG